MDKKSVLLGKIRDKSAHAGVIGMGYVGLPLALQFCDSGFRVTGFDIDNTKVSSLNAGKSYIKHVAAERIGAQVASGRFRATSDFDLLAECDVVIIAVPTPLSEKKEPDLTYINKTAEAIAKRLRPGQLISLESTTYPGTTRELLLSRFEKDGMAVGEDFFLVFSPEREDPGNDKHQLSTIPKVVGGVTPACQEVGEAIYQSVVGRVVRVSSCEVAEMTKLLENIFRSVNIALVNELKMLCDRMGLNIWEVIEASSTKPFGFMPFYPGPGLGGHCIPIDPFYLSWKAREYDFSTRFIELAGEINTHVPYWVMGKVAEALNGVSKCLNGASILMLGMAYKKNVDDMRESPALTLLELLEKQGAKVSYHDPYVPSMPKTRKFDFHLASVPLTAQTLSAADLVLIVTDHDSVDYAMVVQHSKIVVDTRNATKRVAGEKKNVVMA
ncbi:MAG: nucleotide sugar dehydrogenase [Nitrospinota bacterium]|nr:nucleotide sugar dehydrogenase [Nitrospinota bacterium]